MEDFPQSIILKPGKFALRCYLKLHTRHTQRIRRDATHTTHTRHTHAVWNFTKVPSKGQAEDTFGPKVRRTYLVCCARPCVLCTAGCACCVCHVPWVDTRAHDTYTHTARHRTTRHARHTRTPRTHATHTTCTRRTRHRRHAHETHDTCDTHAHGTHMYEHTLHTCRVRCACVVCVCVVCECHNYVRTRHKSTHTTQRDTHVTHTRYTRDTRSDTKHTHTTCTRHQSCVCQKRRCVCIRGI